MAIASRKASSTVTTNNAYNKNLLPFFGSLQETSTLGEDKNVRETFEGPLGTFWKKIKILKILTNPIGSKGK